jgi:hypothetical protein
MRFLAISVALALLLCGSTASAQNRFGLGDEAFAVYQRWVLATCVGGDERALANDLRRHAAELGPAFGRAVVEGPSPEDLRAVREAATQNFERRQKFPLDEVPIEGVRPADLERFRAVPAESFVNDQVRRFATGYRANAVAALGVIGDARSRAALARMARNPRDPLRAAAVEALRRPPPPR